MHASIVPNEFDALDAVKEDARWVVLHTRPRSEKKVAAYCHQEAVPLYLPLRTKIHHYGRRRREFSSPLFPGYVFCMLTPKDCPRFKQNQHVANLLQVVDQTELLGQLQQIRDALSTGQDVEVLPYLAEGKQVRVVGGAFKGIEGVVTRIKGKQRVMINVDMIQQCVSIEVDSAFLQPA